MAGDVVVWGNCQAPAVADLLRPALAPVGLTVLEVPPAFLITREELDAVRRKLRSAAALITQPISDDYRFAGCGWQQMSALLPPAGRTVTIPISYDRGPFPFLANAHGADGARVDAPLTVYHDLRTLAAAAIELGLRDRAVQDASDGALTEVVDASRAELQRREQDLDVAAADVVCAPEAMWSIDHPTNTVLAAVAGRVSDLLGGGPIDVPEREFLGATRAPVSAGAAHASGYAERGWTIDRAALDDGTVGAAHRDFYRTRPDVVADALHRFADRFDALT